MSSVLRGVRDVPVAQTSYLVRADIVNLPIGSTQAAINTGVAAARGDGYTVKTVGNVIDVDPAVYMDDYFNGDVNLNGGDLLRDMGKDLILTYKGAIFMRARLVTKVKGIRTEGCDVSAPFYVTTFEAYGAGGVPNGGGGYTSDVFVTRV